jgi:hypothetical protein
MFNSSGMQRYISDTIVIRSDKRAEGVTRIFEVFACHYNLLKL